MVSDLRGWVSGTHRVLTALGNSVTVHATGLAPEVVATLEATGVTVDGREIVRVIGDGSAISGLELGDGTIQPIGAVFLAGVPHPNNQLARSLGCSVDDLRYVTVDAAGRTNIDGLWAAGDLTRMRHQLSIAIAQGASAAADCVKALILEAKPCVGGSG